MLIRDPGSPKVRNAMREEAISARFYNPEKSTFMDEAADLAEMLCRMIGYSFVRRPISWPARMQLIQGEQNYLLEAAHNPSGMARSIPEIAAMLPEKWSLLLGTSPQQNMDAFLSPLLELIRKYPPVEIITTEPQNGRYPGVQEPLTGAKHIEKPSVAIESFEEETQLIVVTGSLYLCGNILSYLGINADILS
jgi:folylpolyglutamate synthase/dihydropteroate synthase